MKGIKMRLVSKVRQWNEILERKLLENGILLMFCIAIGIFVFAWLWNCSLEASVRYSLPG